MKKIFFVLTIVCAALFVSCRKDTQSPNTTSSPVNDLFVAANFQGINWVAQPITSFNAANDTLTVKGFYQANNQYLVFKVRFAGPGVYSLTNSDQASFYTVNQSNATTSFYKLDTTKTTNTVTITSFSPSIDIAEGDFQLSFVKTSGPSSSPGTADFANGKLWIQVPIKK